MSDRNEVAEVAGWLGFAFGVGLGAVAMYWWPIAVPLFIIGAVVNVLHIVVKESTP